MSYLTDPMKTQWVFGLFLIGVAVIVHLYLKWRKKNYGDKK